MDVFKIISKPLHWNLGIGIGIGIDITNIIMSSSIRPIDPKLSRVVTYDERIPLKITWLFDIVVTWQIKNVSPLLQGLCTPNSAGWWLRMRRPHPQSHVTLISWSLNKLKKHISTFTRPINSKLRSVVFLDEGTPPTKSRDDNSKTSSLS